MSEDKELLEVWRKEFLSSLTGYDFRAMSAEEIAWRGFLAAKRSQPSVVLPKQINCEGVYFDLNGYEAEEIHERLTAAGIKYTIGN